jgi:hypothetical protein
MEFYNLTESLDTSMIISLLFRQMSKGEMLLAAHLHRVWRRGPSKEYFHFVLLRFSTGWEGSSKNETK